MSILKLENLTYSYEGSKNIILKGISREFEKGSIYAIVGKSGEGKTTTLSLLSGLTSPSEGNIYFDGQNLKNIDKYRYRNTMVGVIFQGYNLLPQLTAEENVVLSLDLTGKKIKNKKEVAQKALLAVELDDDKAKRRILKLSGGEQQRVAIARTLCYEPDIILADEPTGNLDNDTGVGIMNIFKKLAREDNKCVIIVTHSDKVAGFADKIITLKDGLME
jgi:putative ABC transport system ATP-binding protein